MNGWYKQQRFKPSINHGWKIHEIVDSPIQIHHGLWGILTAKVKHPLTSTAMTVGWRDLI